MHSGYGIAFDGNELWIFCNDFAGNVIVFGVNNSLSSHSDTCNNKFLVLGEGVTFAINGSFGALEKKLRTNFSKVKTKFCLQLHYNGDNSYMFVYGKEIYKSKADNKKANFPLSITKKCL